MTATPPSQLRLAIITFGVGIGVALLMVVGLYLSDTEIDASLVAGVSGAISGAVVTTVIARTHPKD